MTIKLARKHLFIITVCALIWNQQTSFIAQKIAIENSYQQKVFGAVSRMLGQEKFLVIVSIEYSTVGGALNKTSLPQTGSGSSSGYIPGLPTVPTSQGTPKLYDSDLQGSTTNDFGIGRVEVTIGMDETSITGSVKQEIKSLVEKIIPQTKNCEDCIKIEAMQFQNNQKTEKLIELEAKIDELENAKREADLAADAIKLANLEKQLTEATKARTALEAMAKSRELQQLEEGAIRFAQLVASEKARQKQDSLRFVQTEKRLERVMESKIKSDSVIISETMNIVKQQVDGGNNEESLLGINNGGGSGMMGFILIIFLVISLMIVTFLAANNKNPKTVYLKPKDNEKKANKAKLEKEDENAKSEIEDVKLEPEFPPPRPDEDALRSELRSLRQTAVSLTVGEKEGASALIKEWLEDNPNKQEEGDGGEGE